MEIQPMQMVCAVIAVAFLFSIILRRKKRGGGDPGLVEYALTAAFVVTVAGALMPSVTSNLQETFNKVNVLLQQAVRQTP